MWQSLVTVGVCVCYVQLHKYYHIIGVHDVVQLLVEVVVFVCL